MSSKSLSVAEAMKHAEQLLQLGNAAISRQLFVKILEALPNNHGLRPKAEALLAELDLKYVGDAEKLKLQKLYESGAFDKALAEGKRLIGLYPKDWTILDFLGGLNVLKGKFADSIPYFDAAIDLCPKQPSPYSNKANALENLGDLKGALACSEQAVSLMPDHPKAMTNKGNILMKLAAYEKALDCFQSALAQSPENPITFVNVARAWNKLGQFDQALALLDRAVAIDPMCAEAFNVKGNSLLFSDQFDEAAAQYDSALKIRPEFDIAKVGKSLTQFWKGDLRAAWPNHDARDLGQLATLLNKRVHRWQGEPLCDKTLFVAREQGIGDEVMWGHFLPFLYDATKHLVVLVDDRLVSSYQRRFPNASVLGAGSFASESKIEEAIVNKQVDCWTAIGSAPQFDWQSPEQVVPHSNGFLFPSNSHSQAARSWLNTVSSKPKIAIAWRSGIKSPQRDRNYADIEQLAPMFTLADKVDFINLQYGEVEREIARAHANFGVTIHQMPGVDMMNDIEANLALCDAVDCVVTVASAPGQFALSVGAKTFFAVYGSVWWTFGRFPNVPFAQNGVIVPAGNNWRDTYARICDDVAAYLFR